MANAGNGAEPHAQVKKPRNDRWTRFVSYVKRKMHERRAKKQEETSQDRSTRHITTATVWMAIFTFVLMLVSGGTLWVLKKQLKEMHDGGVDTHNLAVATGDQATWTQRLAASADTESGHMKELADRTKELAAQAKSQAEEAKVAAAAAQSAATTAKDALHISERAYLILGNPVDNLEHGKIQVPVVNTGHIPSGIAKILVQEATYSIPDPAVPTVNTLQERHWMETSLISVPVMGGGSLEDVEIRLPKMVAADLKSGKQGVMISLKMSYRDGFPDSVEQTWLFCEASRYFPASKEFTMRPCDDPSLALQILTKITKYPSSEYKEQNPN